uniref:7TM_GPCR_Srx domain-containing protein n=1 Tax=Caenorhabditis japonica TaxID=281687 RepID=A0A8R1DII8_CAEJA
MNFLKQACLQAFVFVCELITYFILTPRWNPDDKWTRFFMTTTAWVCVHMFDGIITISFNKEFIQTVFKGIRIKDLSDQHNHATKENSTNWAIHSARI